jgi:hypothetical protein
LNGGALNRHMSNSSESTMLEGLLLTIPAKSRLPAIPTKALDHEGVKWPWTFQTNPPASCISLLMSHSTEDSFGQVYLDF